jgi:hypothetical protein
MLRADALRSVERPCGRRGSGRVGRDLLPNLQFLHQTTQAIHVLHCSMVPRALRRPLRDLEGKVEPVASQFGDNWAEMRRAIVGRADSPICALAAPQEGSLSVMITSGAKPCFFRSLRMSFTAAG